MFLPFAFLGHCAGRSCSDGANAALLRLAKPEIPDRVGNPGKGGKTEDPADRH